MSLFMPTIDLLEVVLQQIDGAVEKVYLLLGVNSLLVLVNQAEELLVSLSDSEVLLIHGHAERDWGKGSFWDNTPRIEEGFINPFLACFK